MAKTPVMQTTVTANTNRREVIITVEHENWQSFARAITPKARREFRNWIRENVMFGDLREIDRSFAWFSTRAGRCISFIRYSY